MIIEEPIITASPGPKSVTMFTTIGLDRVLYAISVEDTATGEKSTVWRKQVLFGKTDANCAGGPAFREAAREQHKRAWELAQ